MVSCILVSRLRILNSGFWFLVSGFWILNSGFWLFWLAGWLAGWLVGRMATGGEAGWGNQGVQVALPGY